MWDTLYQAFSLVFNLDPEVWSIAFTSISVSAIALLNGVILGLPLGAFLAIANFPGKKWCLTILNTCMNVPTVIIGVLIYLLLSRSGPLGDFGLLFTKTGMIIAQTLLTTPIIAAVSGKSLLMLGNRIGILLHLFICVCSIK